MHELSIVLSIVETAEEQVRKHAASRVESIELEIGDLAGVEPDALYFAWEAAVPETVLSGAARKVTEVPAKAKCMDCSHEFPTDQLYSACPKCGEYFTELIQGRELKIRTMTLSRKS